MNDNGSLYLHNDQVTDHDFCESLGYESPPNALG